MALHWTLAALTFMLATSGACRGAFGRNDPGREGLEPSGPKEVFRSDGGSLEVWSSDFRVLQDANVAADRLTLEPRGLALFKYSDAAQLAYVLQGESKIGLSYPWEQSDTHVRTVKEGDVIAIPRGIANWWYNSGEKRFVVIRVADTVHAVNRGENAEFYLNGGSSKEGASVLHGFDEELLSQAWDVDRDVVRQIRDSQKGTVIVKVNEDLDISADSESSESEEFWAQYTYNIDQAQPDIEVNNGGSFSLLTKATLPILKEVHLSAIRVKLDREALFAPSYTWNAYVLIYITKGNGRIQIVGSDHEGRLLDSDVKEGSLVVVPQFYPDIIKASKAGLEFVAIATSERPIFSFLAGKNAVYRNIPVEVSAAGNNVPVEVEQQIRDRRQHDAVIFPPRGKVGSATKEDIVKLNDLFFLQVEELKAILDLKSHIRA